MKEVVGSQLDQTRFGKDTANQVQHKSSLAATPVSRRARDTQLAIGCGNGKMESHSIRFVTHARREIGQCGF